MAEREHLTNEKGTDVERNSEDIRQDIAQGEEDLSQTVDLIGERIKETLDWHEYVRDSPYLAIGGAAGLGYLASRVFAKRATPLERVMGSIGGRVRDSLGGLVGPSLIRGALLGLATKAAAGWIERSVSTAGTHGDAAPRSQTGPNPTIDPSRDT
jgi:ElaB/YqjD/DUF883 family membrane-anchored ribosome-binding protein